MKAKIKEFFSIHESKIILVLGLVLVAFVSFEVGVIKGKENTEKPILIENVILDQTNSASSKDNDKPAKIASENQDDNSITDKNCVFVGSKNSNKYHLLSCRWAKNIKPENQICFSSKNDAESKGYLPDKNCIK